MCHFFLLKFAVSYIMEMHLVAVILLVVALFFAICSGEYRSHSWTDVLLVGAIVAIAMVLSVTPHQMQKITGGNSKYVKMELMDPKHNMREVAKQMILIEDHMAHKPKRCVDCLTKHYLMVEGLLEETITLDKTGEHTDEVNNIIGIVKPTMMDIIEKIKNSTIVDQDYQAACQTLRTVRKEIALKYVLNI